MSPRKKVIVSVISDLATDQRVQRCCNTLYDHGYEILLIGRKLPDSISYRSEKFQSKRFRLPVNSGPLFYIMFNLRLFFYLLFTKADILLANDLDTLLPNVVVSVIRKRICIYDSHEYFTGVPEIRGRKFVKCIWTNIERFCITKIDAMYTVNESIADMYRDKYGIDVSVVRNVPDVPQDHIDEPKSELRKELDLPEDEFLVILQGSGINIDRGAEEAVEAMRYLDGIRLLIAGSGDVIGKLKESAGKEGLAGKIIFRDKMPYSELMKYTATADLGLTLDKDTNLNYKFSLPNKLFDYIISGTPVLTSRLPEIEKIITKYEIGEFISSHDPEHIASRIKSMSIDRSILEKYQRNLRTAASELNWKNERLKLLNIFESVEK